MVGDLYAAPSRFLALGLTIDDDMSPTQTAWSGDRQTEWLYIRRKVKCPAWQEHLERRIADHE